ncbi:hypothetical protein SAMN04488001_1162 [Litoreibacter albidus]|uniref:Uncharacterized protein n=1 Tax=Litoreibacter albidus TaxID=670155 RepID=A0A1H2TH01_9RHOB|nr:hypothetical protein SAMN04488001_1162 [Litoreibacter albidus]
MTKYPLQSNVRLKRQKPADLLTRLSYEASKRINSRSDSPILHSRTISTPIIFQKLIISEFCLQHYAGARLDPVPTVRRKLPLVDATLVRKMSETADELLICIPAFRGATHRPVLIILVGNGL